MKEGAPPAPRPHLPPLSPSSVPKHGRSPHVQVPPSSPLSPSPHVTMSPMSPLTPSHPPKCHHHSHCPHLCAQVSPRLPMPPSSPLSLSPFPSVTMSPCPQVPPSPRVTIIPKCQHCPHPAPKRHHSFPMPQPHAQVSPRPHPHAQYPLGSPMSLSPLPNVTVIPLSPSSTVTADPLPSATIISIAPTPKCHHHPLSPSFPSPSVTAVPIPPPNATIIPSLSPSSPFPPHVGDRLGAHLPAAPIPRGGSRAGPPQGCCE